MELEVLTGKFGKKKAKGKLKDTEIATNGFMGVLANVPQRYTNNYPRALFECAKFASFDLGPMTHDSAVSGCV